MGVLHTPSRHTFECDGTQRVFPIPSFIISHEFVRIEIDGELQSDRKQWDIVNNSLVFVKAPNSGAILDVQVASDSEALGELGSLSNVDIVAQNIDNVNATGSNIEAVVKVAESLDIVADGFEEVKTVAENIADVITNAININDIKTVAGISQEIVYLDNIKDEISSVASIDNSVVTVANIEPSVINVANNELNINEVASIKEDVITVANLEGEISLIRDNIIDIQKAPTNAINTILYSYEAEAHRLTANSYAVEPENTYVKIYTSNGDGTFTVTDTTDYSALHWERKAGDLITSGIIDDTVPAVNRTYSSSKVHSELQIINIDIGLIEGDIQTINTDIGLIEGDIQTINTDIGLIEGDIQTINTDLGLIDVRVQAVETEVGLIDGRVQAVETDVGLIDGRVQTVETFITDLDGVVKTTGNQTITGVITFNSSPIVPTPTAYTQVANKAYVDSKLGAISFEASLTNNGYQKLPGGLIIQWGRSRATIKEGSETLSFPIAFPRACLQGVATVLRTGSLDGNISAYFQANGNTTFNLTHDAVTTKQESYVQWIAVGY